MSKLSTEAAALNKSARRLTIFVIALILLVFIGAGILLYSFNGELPQNPAYPDEVLPVLPSESGEAVLTESFAVPALSFDTASPLLTNPDRGLRMEAYITLGEPAETYPGKSEDPYEKLKATILKYAVDSPTVVQLYVYLSRYTEKALDAAAFSQLEKMLKLCSDLGIRVLLRFAYQNESVPDPNYDRVKGHLGQMEAWFFEHGKLLEDTLYSMQAGIVGMWGEGHSNVNLKSEYMTFIFDQVMRMTPEDVFVQFRNLDLMAYVSKKYQSRLAAHDDYLIGEAFGPWSFFNGRKEMKYIDGFKRTLNDGEMPWGVATYYDKPGGAPLNALDAKSILEQIKQYSLTTLSLEHNYREGAGPTAPYSMERWKSQYLSIAELSSMGMPYHPELFKNSSGQVRPLSVYDYIRYHLGYLLTVTSARIDTANRRLSFTVQNNGFAAPLNANALSVLIDGKEYLLKSYDKYALGSMQAVSYEVKLPADFDIGASHNISVKLANRAGSDISLRFANATQFADGAQLIYAS